MVKNIIMKKYTAELKKEIIKLDSCEERIDFLKDKYKGKTAVITLPGPSLNDYDHNELRKIFSNREDLVIIPNKGSYDLSLGTSDFHVMNPWNINKKVPLNYENPENTIVFWNVTAAFQDNHLEMISNNNHLCDIWVPCYTEPWIKKEQCIHNTCNFEQFWLLGKEYKTIWGTPILYSTAIPLALHLGCKDFIIMGWDTHMFNKHKDKKAHYNQPDNDFKSQPWIKEEEVKIIESSYKLYDWCAINNINMKLLTDISPIDNRFERLKSIKDI
tara:strand:+ start:262 stop:1077 length:816 start_codon:yes stop_codon:yes gene_type:complete